MCNTLNQISEKISGYVLQEGGNTVADFRHLIAELEGMLQKEKEELEVRLLHINFWLFFPCSLRGDCTLIFGFPFGMLNI